MALLTRKETGPLGTVTEEWDIDPMRLGGTIVVLVLAKGASEWISSELSKALKKQA